PSQRAMAIEIAKLYNRGGIGLLEAGTGVGKSLGYLVPALRWAAANNERTIVSTNTINLQEQLVRKDLPFLAKALDDQPVRFALLKGWRNYLCLSRLHQARSSGNALFEDGTQQELDAIHSWAERTSDGSLSDLTITPRSEVWDEVAAEPDLCQRARCPQFDQCFLFKARKAAAHLGQLGRIRGVARVHASRRRRRTSPRGRGGRPPRLDGVAAFAPAFVQS